MGSSTSEPGHAARALAFGLAVAAAGGAGAQQPPPPAPPDTVGADEAAEPVPTLPDGTRRVRGRVVTPRDSAVAGVPGVWVTLHRVGRDAAGPVDSVRTDARGAYAMTYRPRGDAGAVYFVATSRGGVAYFTAPLRNAVVEGDAAEVTVFDTASAGVPLHVGGRHLIVARPGPGGTREVLEVFELANDTTVTVVPGDRPGGVWSTPLPNGATGFAARESSDVPADGLAAVGGRAALMVPVAPGIKQVAFSYQLPAGAFPLRVPVERGTGVVEVLLEEPQGTASGAGLAPVGPVALEGKTFRRFLAQSAAEGGMVEVAVGEVAGAGWPRYAVPALLAGVGGAMAAALLLAGRRRGARVATPREARPEAAPRPAATATPDVTAERDRLLTELAALDDAFAARPAPTAAERAAYEARRAEVKARLARELAVAPVAAAPVAAAPVAAVPGAG